ncbi:MAG TPA: cytochrome c biogenesis protein CcsA [Gemmatimonadaceae bacterium]|nr:cytochrome c biogenesis protein CcsA [Gemmatimonadaceae bacterium]
MIAIAHSLAITLYLGAAALAAAPFARPLPAPVRSVTTVLGLGVVAHTAGLLAFVVTHGQAPVSGLGPALSLASLLVAVLLLAVELIARDVSLSLAAAPLAAALAVVANVAGLSPAGVADGAQGAWLAAHVALSFLGIASFATAAAAGVMYMVERRELKARRFGAIFRFFPPLETLDRVNHLASLAGGIALTLGVAIAIAYSVEFRTVNMPQILWGAVAWIALSVIAIGRALGGWQARRAAVVTSTSFAAVVLLYVALRVAGAADGGFL